MMSIWRNADGLDVAAADAAESAFTTMLAADVGAGPLLADTGRETLDATLRAAITRHVEANLRTGNLTPRQVSRRFGISVRKLHALYEGSEGSFAQTVTAMRVDACARELASSTAGSLSDAAARWGFCDLSHLNRVFRLQKGCLPSEYRARAAGTS